MMAYFVAGRLFHPLPTGDVQNRRALRPWTKRGKAPRQTARASAPEKVIPLKGDDNTGTDDFKEFNG